jgi:NDP-sugar pyrophosphorylase family protein
MKAMVLAAGLGTRLRPLTDTRPKALVQINRKTLLEITLARLQSFGIREVVINVHHFPDLITDFLKSKNNFGMHIEISREEDLLLDTGGGLKKAASFFQQDGTVKDEPFILHNVDVVSNVDLRQMLDFHEQQNALATLMAQQRSSSRYLLFDDDLVLCGRRFEKENKTEWACPTGRDCPPPRARKSKNLQTLAFSGIHIISPRLLNMISEEGAFSIIVTYLRLAAAGERILAFRDDRSYWRDLGNPESLAQAESDLREHRLT